MPNEDALIKEFEKARERYYELLAKLIELGVPGVIDLGKAAAKCDVGEVCHGGTFRSPLDLGRPPDFTGKRPAQK